MAKVVAYIDGSCVKKGPRSYSLGWACVLNVHDSLIEVSGARMGNKLTCGLHEIASFIEAVLYLHSHGYSFSDVALYTDDQIIGYYGHGLHPENYAGDKAEHLTSKLATTVEFLNCPAHVVDLCLDFLRQARVHKVKGHSRQVYQERADYLARSAANNLAEKSASVLSFMDWLTVGVPYYNGSTSNSPQWWHPPFCKPDTEGFLLA